MLCELWRDVGNILAQLCSDVDGILIAGDAGQYVQLERLDVSEICVPAEKALEIGREESGGAESQHVQLSQHKHAARADSQNAYIFIYIKGKKRQDTRTHAPG